MAKLERANAELLYHRRWRQYGRLEDDHGALSSCPRVGGEGEKLSQLSI